MGDDALNGSLTYFDNRYQNFIEAVNLPGTAIYPYYVQTFENLEAVRIYGLEAKAHGNSQKDGEPLDHWRGRLVKIKTISSP